MVALWVAFAGLPGTAEAAPCPPGTSPAFSVGPRSQIAFDRQASVEVYAEPGNQLGVPSDLRVDIVDVEGDVLFSHAFPPDDVPGLAENWGRFPIRLGRGDPPVLVRLSYTLPGA
jgi:hypothetical protein